MPGISGATQTGLLNKTIALLVTLFLVACESANNGGQLGAAAQDTEAPELNGTIPLLSLEEPRVETDLSIKIRFSELLDEPSLLSTNPSPGNINLELKLPDGDSSGQISDSSIRLKYEEMTLTPQLYLKQGTDVITGLPNEILASSLMVKPSSRLYALDSAYQLNIEQGIKDISPVENFNPITGVYDAGNFLSQRSSLTFRTVKGEWNDQYLLPVSGDTDVNQYDSAANSNNDRTFVWTEIDQSYQYTLHAARYDAVESTWHALEANNLGGISTIATGNATNQALIAPHISLYEDGSALVLWLQEGTMGPELVARGSFFDGQNWTLLTGILESGINNASIKEIVLGPMPDGFRAYWLETNDNGNSMLFQDLTINGQGAIVVGTPLALSTQSTLELSGLRATAKQSSAGYLLTWLENDNSAIYSVHAATHVDGVSFVAGSEFNTATGMNAPYYDIALNSADEGALVWQQYDGQRYNIWRARAIQNRFSTAELVEQDSSGNSLNPSVSACYGSQTTIFWAQNSGGVTEVVSRTHNLEGWEDVITHDTISTSDEVTLSSMDDPNCNTLAVWHVTASDVLRSSNYSKLDTLWSDAETIIQLFGTSPAKSGRTQLVKSTDNGRHLTSRLVESDGSKRIAIAAFDDN